MKTFKDLLSNIYEGDVVPFSLKPNKNKFAKPFSTGQVVELPHKETPKSDDIDAIHAAKLASKQNLSKEEQMEIARKGNANNQKSLFSRTGTDHAVRAEIALHAGDESVSHHIIDNFHQLPKTATVQRTNLSKKVLHNLLSRANGDKPLEHGMGDEAIRHQGVIDRIATSDLLKNIDTDGSTRQYYMNSLLPYHISKEAVPKMLKVHSDMETDRASGAAFVYERMKRILHGRFGKM